MTEKDVMEAYLLMRKADQIQSISSEVLEFMKDCAIEKVRIQENRNKKKDTKPTDKRKLWEEEYSDDCTWEEFDKKTWYWCKQCKSWQDDYCICYAR